VEELGWLSTTSRTAPDDPFPPGAEDRLGDFASLVAQAVHFLRWEGVHDEVVVVGGWSDGTGPPIEARLRSFADLASQSIANARAGGDARVARPHRAGRRRGAGAARAEPPRRRPAAARRDRGNGVARIEVVDDGVGRAGTTIRR
jgi:hypothetical protein